MSLLWPFYENHKLVKQFAVTWLCKNRTAGFPSNLLGIGVLGAAYFLLPGFFLLPFTVLWGVGIAQSETVALFTFAITTSALVYGYVNIIGEDIGYLFVDRFSWQILANILVLGLVLIGTGELLLGLTIGDGVTAIQVDTVGSLTAPLLCFGAVILIPLTHEAFFRGVIQDHAAASLPTGASILASSTAFSILYRGVFYQGDFVEINATLVFVLIQGCFFGYLYWRHRTILAPWIAHAMVNLYTFIYVFM